MKKFFTLMCTVALFLTATAQKSIYDFNVKTANGEVKSMSDYRGKTLLIVNTATRCGFTPQYEGLEKMYEKFKDDGFVVLDFPCNQFGEQAPGDIAAIQTFCTSNFHTTFPLFDKIDVNGDNADPLFIWLKSQKGFKGFDVSNPIGKKLHEEFIKQNPKYANSPDIKWNFTKFLIDKDGNVVERFEPTTDIYDVLDAVYNLIYMSK